MGFLLNNPPEDDRRRELWLQHAAGFILFQDMRQYAIDKISPDVNEQTRQHIIQGIDNALYGLMMIMDGVSGTLQNDTYEISIESNLVLTRDRQIIQTINTLDGDGMCMGFHGWKEDDFGTDPVCQPEA